MDTFFFVFCSALIFLPSHFSRAKKNKPIQCFTYICTAQNEMGYFFPCFLRWIQSHWHLFHEERRRRRRTSRNEEIPVSRFRILMSKQPIMLAYNREGAFGVSAVGRMVGRCAIVSSKRNCLEENKARFRIVSASQAPASCTNSNSFLFHVHRQPSYSSYSTLVATQHSNSAQRAHVTCSVRIPTGKEKRKRKRKRKDWLKHSRHAAPESYCLCVALLLAIWLFCPKTFRLSIRHALRPRLPFNNSPWSIIM